MESYIITFKTNPDHWDLLAEKISQYASRIKYVNGKEMENVQQNYLLTYLWRVKRETDRSKWKDLFLDISITDEGIISIRVGIDKYDSQSDPIVLSSEEFLDQLEKEDSEKVEEEVPVDTEQEMDLDEWEMDQLGVWPPTKPFPGY